MNIEENRVVSIHYELKNDAGDVLDSSAGSDPLTYLHGTGALIPGLERELLGKVSGDELDAVVSPEDAYGAVNNELIRQVPVDAFGETDLEVGMRFQAPSNDDAMQVFTVVAIVGDMVTVDGNHPLAGETLFFNVRVDNVRAATDSELEHGHVH